MKNFPVPFLNSIIKAFKITPERIIWGAGQMAQWIGTHATKPDDLNSIPGLLIIEEGNQLPQVVPVTFILGLWHRCASFS